MQSNIRDVSERGCSAVRHPADRGLRRSRCEVGATRARLLAFSGADGPGEASVVVDADPVLKYGICRAVDAAAAQASTAGYSLPPTRCPGSWPRHSPPWVYQTRTPRPGMPAAARAAAQRLRRHQGGYLAARARHAGRSLLHLKTGARARLGKGGTACLGGVR